MSCWFCPLAIKISILSLMFPVVYYIYLEISKQPRNSRIITSWPDKKLNFFRTEIVFLCQEIISFSPIKWLFSSHDRPPTWIRSYFYLIYLLLFKHFFRFAMLLIDCEMWISPRIMLHIWICLWESIYI